jgi:hypothetical protein
MANASGRPSFGICAYFPAGGAPYNGGYFYGLAVYYPGGGQSGANIGSSYGPGNGLYHAADAYFPQIGRSNGAASTTSKIGFSGIHCVEAIPSATLDHIVVDGQEVPSYTTQGQSPDLLGAGQLTAPMYLAGGAGIQSGAPITIYSTWAATNADSVAIAEARTSSELARLQSLGVPIGIVDSAASDSTCSFDGTSIDQGFQSGGASISTLLNLDFPCTLHDFSESGQPPMDMNYGFPDRAGSVYHPNAQRNIAFNGGVVNGVIRYLEPPQLALQDVLNWNAQAHALGYKTIVTTMMSECASPGYNGQSGDSLAQQFNALLLADAAQFDWVDNLAAWPSLGAIGACSGPAFADGLHLSILGQSLYVANERVAFEGVYAKPLTTVSGPYSQQPSDRTIQVAGGAYSIQLIDANSASFNAAGRLCIQNTNPNSIQVLPVTGETIDGASSLAIAGGSTVCVRPIVANPATAGANWTVN